LGKAIGIELPTSSRPVALPRSAASRWDQVYRDVGGQRPLFNPEGRPTSQAIPEAASVVAGELPRIPAAAANTVLRAIRGGDIGAEDKGFVDWAIRQTEAPDTKADP
jgi:hypothetical protein